MGAVKQMLIEEHEREREQEARGWFIAKHGRPPRPGELARKWDDFELGEAFESAMSKDD